MRRLSRRRPLRSAQVALAGRVAVLLLLLVAWQVLAHLGVLDSEFVSTPIAVARSVGRVVTKGSVLAAFGQTGLEVLIAFAVGTTLGLLVGVAIGLSQLLRDALMGVLNFLLSMPKSLFLPIFILYFGIGTSSAAAYGAFSAFFFVAASVIGGVDLVQERLLTMSRAYGASTRQRVVEVVFPGAAPGIFAALWQGIHHALGGVLIVELFASTGGVGQLVEQYTNNAQPQNAIAVAFAISALAIGVASVWSALERRLSRWRTQAFL
jgi:ABC-type nitrate/sulfonate/bicarbonate transport system permease component